MTAGEVTEFIECFAKVSRAPVLVGVNVTSARRTGDGYHVTTSHGEIHSRAVVIASGACNERGELATIDAVARCSAPPPTCTPATSASPSTGPAPPGLNGA
jgi:putative flavoprotein involved in K+ transport